MNSTKSTSKLTQTSDSSSSTSKRTHKTIPKDHITPSISIIDDHHLSIPISQFSTLPTILSSSTSSSTSPITSNQNNNSTNSKMIKSDPTTQLTLPFPTSSSSSSTTTTTTTTSSNPKNTSIFNTRSDRKQSTSSSSSISISNNPNQTKPIKPPAQCSFCGMTFKKLEHCQRHERTHTLARPYTCTVCLKTFARQDTLNRHSRLHTRPEDGQFSKTKKRNRRNSMSSTNTTPPTPTHSICHSDQLSTINLPNSSFNSSLYFSSPQLSRSRPARERGFSLSAIDEQSPCNLSPSYHPLPFSPQQRQSISLPPHWHQYPNLLPNPHHHPPDLLNHSTHHWDSTSTSNHLTSTSPLLPNLSSPAPLDSNLLAELSSYTLNDLPPSTTTHPSFQSIPTSHSQPQSVLLPPPMSAPATCTTWRDLNQTFHSHPSSSSSRRTSIHPSQFLPSIDQETELSIDPWTLNPTSSSTWYPSSSSELPISYQLSTYIDPTSSSSLLSIHDHPSSLPSDQQPRFESSNESLNPRVRSTSQPEGFHPWNPSHLSSTHPSSSSSSSSYHTHI